MTKVVALALMFGVSSLSATAQLGGAAPIGGGGPPAPISVGPFAADEFVILSGQNGIVRYLPWMGDGTFGAPLVAFDFGPTASGAGAGVRDVDGDGDLDIVVGAWSTTAPHPLGGTGNGVGFLLLRDLGGLTTSGMGIPAPASQAPPPIRVGKIAIGDFSADGNMDVIMPLARLGSHYYDGATSPPIDINPQAYGRVGEVGDFNGDGNLDYVTIAQDPRNIMIAFGDGSAPNPGNPGPLQSPQLRILPHGTWRNIRAPFQTTIDDIAVGDYNLDGNLDLLCAVHHWGTNFAEYAARLHLFFGDGSGEFPAGVVILESAIPEENGGRAAIAVGYDPSGPSSGSTAVAPFDGPRYPIRPGTYAIDTYDYTGDGILDLVLAINPDDGAPIGDQGQVFFAPGLPATAAGTPFFADYTPIVPWGVLGTNVMVAAPIAPPLPIFP